MQKFLSLQNFVADKFAVAITTTFYGTTNFKGARVKATIDGVNVTIPWSHGETSTVMQHYAAMELAYKKYFNRELQSRELVAVIHGQRGYQFAVAPSRRRGN